MGLCVIEGNRGGGGRSGEEFLNAVGSNGFSWWWSYYNPSFPTSGYVEFADLDFTNVQSFDFASDGNVSVLVNGSDITSGRTSGTANVNGATGVTVRTYANDTNRGSSAPIRGFRIPRYTDIHGVVHTL